MKSIIKICVLSSLIACSDHESFNVPTTTSNVNEVLIYLIDCNDEFCNDYGPITGQEIEIFRTREKAQLGTEPMFVGSTNAEGRLTFRTSSLDSIFIRVNFLKGVYIDKELMYNNTISHHEIKTIVGYQYNYSEQLIRDPIVRFSNPVVGNESQFKYSFGFESNDTLTLPTNYKDGIDFSIKILEQLDNNVFLIEEIFNKVPIDLEGRYKTSSYSEWHIMRDTTIVKPFKNEFIVSPILGFHNSNPTTSFKIPHKKGSDHTYTTLESLNEFDEYTPYLYSNDIVFSNFTFRNVIGTWVCLRDTGGEDIINMYNERDGIIRSIQIYEGIHRRCYDLIIK